MYVCAYGSTTHSVEVFHVLLEEVRGGDVSAAAEPPGTRSVLDTWRERDGRPRVD